MAGDDRKDVEVGGDHEPRLTTTWRIVLELRHLNTYVVVTFGDYGWDTQQMNILESR